MTLAAKPVGKAGNELSVLSAVSQFTGRRTVPQVFVAERCIGGADDLFDLDASGQLAALLQEAESRGARALPAVLRRRGVPSPPAENNFLLFGT